MSTYCDACGLFVPEPNQAYGMDIKQMCHCTGPRGIAKMLQPWERTYFGDGYTVKNGVITIKDGYSAKVEGNTITIRLSGADK